MPPETTARQIWDAYGGDLVPISKSPLMNCWLADGGATVALHIVSSDDVWRRSIARCDCEMAVGDCVLVSPVSQPPDKLTVAKLHHAARSWRKMAASGDVRLRRANSP